MLVNEKIRQLVDFTIPADHKKKIAESENIDKFLILTRGLKQLRSIRVTVISIVVGAFGSVPKCLRKKLEELEIRGRGENIQVASLRSARIPKRD